RTFERIRTTADHVVVVQLPVLELAGLAVGQKDGATQRTAGNDAAIVHIGAPYIFGINVLWQPGGVIAVDHRASARDIRAGDFGEYVGGNAFRLRRSDTRHNVATTTGKRGTGGKRHVVGLVIAVLRFAILHAA